MGHMQAMKLPHPHRIAEALPGNLRSGKPREETPSESWAPLSRSYAGLPELPPSWVAEHREALTLLDVRSAEEFHGPDGHVTGSLLIPLPELEQRSGEIPASPDSRITVGLPWPVQWRCSRRPPTSISWPGGG